MSRWKYNEARDALLEHINTNRIGFVQPKTHRWSASIKLRHQPVELSLARSIWFAWRYRETRLSAISLCKTGNSWIHNYILVSIMAVDTYLDAQTPASLVDCLVDFECNSEAVMPWVTERDISAYSISKLVYIVRYNSPRFWRFAVFWTID